MAKIVGDTGNIAGGTSGALRDGLPDVGHERVQERPGAAQVIEGDFVESEIVDSTPAKPETGFNVFDFPSIDGSRPTVVGGGDTIIMFNDSPAAQALVEYLATPEAAEIWAKRGGFSSANKNVRRQRLPGPAAARDRDGDRRCGDVPLRHVRPPAGGVRRARWGRVCGRSSRTSCKQPGRRRRHRAGRWSSRQRRRSRASERASPMSGGAATARTGRGSAAGRRSPSRWRRYRVTLAFLAPAAILLGVWIVYPTIYTIVRSFFDREGSNFVGLDNYKELFTQDTLITAIKNNVLWLAIVPALVTAIGLVFAVLLERVRWSVAFKTVVFMPMAISLFAAGVIWRVMDEKDPEHRRRQRLDQRGRRRGQSAGRAARRAAVDQRRSAAAPRRGLTLEAAGASPATSRCSASPRSRRRTFPKAPCRRARRRPTRARSPASCGATSSPAAASPAWSSSGELGLPGVTVELREPAAASSRHDRDRRRRQLRLRGRRGHGAQVAIGKETFEEPFAGRGLARREPDHARDHARLHLGLGGLRDGGDRRRAGGDPARPAGGGAHRRRHEWQVFRRVTVPLLRPVLVVVFVTMLINVLKVFDIVLSVAPGVEPGRRQRDRARDVAHRRSAGVNDFGLGSAIAVFLFLLVIPILLLNIRNFRREA